MYFDEKVLLPLLQAINTTKDSSLTPIEYTKYAKIAFDAEALGYQLNYYQNQISPQGFLVLAENPKATTRHYWGTYVFRLGKGNPYIIEVPHPIFETNTLEYGIRNAEFVKDNG